MMGAPQQEPVRNGVWPLRAARNCRAVGPLVIPSCQADVGEGDLRAEGRGKGQLKRPDGGSHSPSSGQGPLGTGRAPLARPGHPGSGAASSGFTARFTAPTCPSPDLKLNTPGAFPLQIRTPLGSTPGQ